MTQDEIIEMAIEAEFVSHGKPSDEESELFVCVDKDIYKFAKLVAAKAIAQLESQEPVAWRTCVEGIWFTAGKKAVLHKELVSINSNAEIEPLYILPPQRTWQGLTQSDFNEIYDLFANKVSSDFIFEKMYSTIEAKLKEKNT